MGPYMELIVPSSFYRVDAGLHVLSCSPSLNISLSITSARPLKSISSFFWMYIWYHYVYIHNLCTFYDSFQVMKLLIRLIMMSLWRHSAPNITERYIFKKIVNITIILVNCFYSMSSIIWGVASMSFPF
jgi:small-conductance mechanosensitive channel